MRTFRMLGCVAVLLAFAGRSAADKVELANVPAKVTDAVKKRFPEAKLVGANVEKEGGKTTYEIGIEDKGTHIDVTISGDGVIEKFERTIPVTNVPKAVIATVDAKFPKALVKRTEEVITVKDGKEGLTAYTVLMETADKKMLEVEVTPQGKIVKTTEVK
jgi:hypothetical protein